MGWNKKSGRRKFLVAPKEKLWYDDVMPQLFMPGIAG